MSDRDAEVITGASVPEELEKIGYTDDGLIFHQFPSTINGEPTMISVTYSRERAELIANSLFNAIAIVNARDAREAEPVEVVNG